MEQTITFDGPCPTQTLRSIEHAAGSDSEDLIIGTAAVNGLDGGAGSDELRGHGGGDYLDGGSEGNDVLWGGIGDDRLFGGGDFDVLGRDEDRLYGGGGDDEVVGHIASDALYGGAGDDDLHGDLVGQDSGWFAGDDALYGGSGADRLAGGEGDDTRGGGGADVLVGGTGEDTFRFLCATDSRPGRADVLRAGDGAAAFKNPGPGAGDRIDLSEIDADVETAGDQAFEFAAGSGPARLWLAEIGAGTVVRADVAGTAGWDFELVIADGSTRACAYGAGDFIL